MDGKIAIATGRSRKETAWKNKTMLWSEFANMFRETLRTHETYAEYMAMSKAHRDNIKDVGGYVGGTLAGGKRKDDTVLCKSLITLDIDHGNLGLWETFTMLYGCAAILYSTHTHSPAKPRLRLVIPVSRELTRDEYEPACRMLANDLGIENFDDTTFQPARLMYFSSTSKDGEYIFLECDGAWLNPDELLGRYQDWKDASFWPQSERFHAEIRREIKKQGDPLEKPGLIGAFCRSYTIQEAIETFLNDEYDACDNNRYTYRHGSTAAGLVVYDDKFAYSHHSTDPANGKLCNAFDLVRVHKFGLRDEEADIHTPTNKLPSYTAMMDLCGEDTETKKLAVIERIKAAEDDFEGVEATETDTAWLGLLDVDKKGHIRDVVVNYEVIIEHDPELKSIAFDSLRDNIHPTGNLPWEQTKSGWNDSDIAALRIYMNRKYGIYSPQKTKDAVITAAKKRAFHPIKDYLAALPEWDGTRRVDELLIKYLGAEDNVYTRAAMRKTLTAAIARIYEPGVKFDHLLTLIGPQGIGKSTFWSRLFGQWHSDSLTIADMQDKTGAEKLLENWCLEIAELAGLRKAESEMVKSFISRQDDKFRAAYGTVVESHPRHCIIVGTTNAEDGFLRDTTGNRRVWPVRTPGDSVEKPWQITNGEVEQIWAEVLGLYKAGEKLYLEDGAAEIAIQSQTEAMESDDREGLVREYLNTLLPREWEIMDLFKRREFFDDNTLSTIGTEQRQVVCNMEIWCECFRKDKSQMRKIDSYEITAIMKKIENWRNYDSGTGRIYLPIYGRQRAYIRGTN